MMENYIQGDLNECLWIMFFYSCFRINYCFYFLQLEVVFFDDRGKCEFVEENKMIQKFEGGMKIGVLERKEIKCFWVFRE